MLNDDVTVADDFERTLEAHLLRFSEPMKFATYRLGQFDLGLVVSRESAARQLGIICELETLDHFHDHFTSRTHRWLPHVVGNCPITYAGRPLEGLARPHGALHAKSNILGVANEALGQQAEAAHSIGRALLLASVAAADDDRRCDWGWKRRERGGGSQALWQQCQLWQQLEPAW